MSYLSFNIKISIILEKLQSTDILLDQLTAEQDMALLQNCPEPQVHIGKCLYAFMRLNCHVQNYHLISHALLMIIK